MKCVVLLQRLQIQGSLLSHKVIEVISSRHAFSSSFNASSLCQKIRPSRSKLNCIIERTKLSSFINLRNVICVMLILLTGSSRKDKRAHEVSSRACARLQQGEESCISCASLALLLSRMPVFVFCLDVLS